jgi:hypothetical protein
MTWLLHVFNDRVALGFKHQSGTGDHNVFMINNKYVLINGKNDLKMMKSRELLNALSSKQGQFWMLIILYLWSQNGKIKNNIWQETFAFRLFIYVI